MSTTIKIEDVQAEKGKKKFGLLKIGETPTGPVELPLWIVNGFQKGPTLCLTAGLHPCEYAGIEAVIRTCKEIDPKEMNGAIVAVPVINIPGFRTGSEYVNPMDNLNMMFISPYIREGTISHRIMHALLNKIIVKADYHIDCHGGDLNEAMDPYTVFPKVNSREVDTSSEALARIFGTEDVDCRTPEHARGLFLESAKIGVPSIMSEAGGEGIINEEDVAIHMKGIQNVLQYAGIMDGIPRISAKHKFGQKKFSVVANRGGLVYKVIGTGDFVLKDQKVAEIRNLRGETVDELKSPDEGKVKVIFTHSVMNTGDTIMIGWTLKEASPFPLTDRFYVGK